MTIDEDVVVEEQEAIEESEVSEEEGVENPEPSEEDEVDQPEGEDDEDSVVVSFGDEEPEEPEDEDVSKNPNLVKKLRNVIRAKEREEKRLKRELEAAKAPAQEELELGPEPTLESSKFDEALYKKNYTQWLRDKEKVEAKKAEAAKVQEEQQAAYQQKLDTYVVKQQELGAKDFSESEEVVKDSLNQVQQGIIVEVCDDAAKMVYALGKNPGKLDELMQINNPLLFAKELTKLEAKLNVTSRKAPAPEKRVKSGKTGSGSVDKHLEQLRAKAEKTGDYSEVTRYKKQLRGAK